jgi:hypothetical protein
LINALFTFCTFIPCKQITFHSIQLILCFQQTGELDKLTVRWGKVIWLCVCRFYAALQHLLRTSVTPTGRLNSGSEHQGKYLPLALQALLFGRPNAPSPFCTIAGTSISGAIAITFQVLWLENQEVFLAPLPGSN